MNILGMIDQVAGKWLDWRTEQAMKASAVTEPELLELEYSKERGGTIVLTHPGLATLAAESADFLQAHNAQNYVEMELQPRIDKGGRAILFTIAFKDGETPAIKATRLSKEIDRLQGEITTRQAAQVAASEEITRRGREIGNLLIDNSTLMDALEWIAALDCENFNHPAAMIQEKAEEAIAEVKARAGNE